jgi:hypothetical protein
MRRMIEIALALIVLGAAPARADSDLQLWLEAGVSRKLGRGFEASFEQGIRFGDDVSRVEAVLPDLGVSYRPHKSIRLGLGYRYEYERNRSGEMVARHRPHVEVRPRYEVWRLQLTYRLRYQLQIRSAEEFRHTVRNRLAVELKLKKPLKAWRPGISAEAFHRLDDGDPVHLHKLRLIAGVTYKLGKQDLEFFYASEVAQYDARDPVLHILGLGFDREL